MTAKRPLATLALCAAALAGLALSAALWARQGGRSLAWLDALCSRAADSGCARAEGSPLAAPLGVPLALVGVAFYAALCALGAVARRDARCATACVALAAAGLVVDVGLLSYSLFTLGAVCALCAATYVCTLVALLAALRLRASPAAAPAPPLAFAAALAVALAASAALLVVRARALDPRDFAADPDQALRLAWDAFRAHYEATPVQALAPRSSARRGAERPLLELVLFADFACAHCQRAAVILGEFVERHRDSAALVFEHYPLDGSCNPHSDPVHPGACTLAFAAESARRQGGFWPMHDLLFGRREQWARGVSPLQLGALASEAGLDADRFQADLGSEAVRAAVQADLAEAERLGVTGTPTLFVNGRRMDSIPIPTFLEELLAQAREAAGGTGE